MSKRLAITISGAVSLGSYEAGVLYEVIQAIGQHNTQPITKELEKIEIDVITGASAGGLTAAIAVQKLLYDADALNEPYKNSLYEPWVVDVSLNKLCETRPKDDPTKSIFSSQLVSDIADRIFLTRYSKGNPPVQSPHPASAARIQLGLALSNLNGVDYSRTLATGGSFTYTRYQDTAIAELGATADNLKTWRPVKEAAVASGAFPFFFQVQQINRSQSEYPGSWKGGPLVPFPSSPYPFAYTDGGLFQNEPLGLAKTLVDQIDNHQNTDSRFYLFVAPGARTGTEDLEFTAAKASFAETTGALVGGIFNQARFHEWIMAEEINEEIKRFDSRAMDLHKALLPAEGGGLPDINAATLKPASDALINQLFRDSTTKQFNQQKLDKARERVKAQWQQEYDDLKGKTSPTTADTWIDAIVTLEEASKLPAKDEMVIYGITAEEKELASSGFASFQGFFERTYRDHDYDVGRQKARQFITNLASNPGKLGPIRYPNPPPINPIDHALDGLKIQDTPKAVREKLRGRLENRLGDMLKQVGVPTSLLRGAIVLAVRWWVLNKLLGL